ncbi:hypothetical protein HGP05_08620 [Streptococcus sanguinis]|uniref:Uncharacterized protein n=1 Tax=Streptococcus sanguinis TaxID=1305 RepID=A0A7Y0VBL0_STRSA|nr:hypothetical protein [Streptococcus sanguinis]
MLSQEDLDLLLAYNAYLYKKLQKAFYQVILQSILIQRMGEALLLM